MATPGMAGGFGTGANAGMTEQQIQEQKMIKLMGWAAQESCAGKTVISGVMGFGLGGMFGLFMSSMRYDNNMTPQGEAISKLPMRQQLSQGFREMGKASWSSAKNFGIIGAAYSGTECCIEGLRAKNDLANGVMAGCITGGGLAAKNGPQAMAIGCAGFAAFSAAIDYYTRLPSDDPGADVVT